MHGYIKSGGIYFQPSRHDNQTRFTLPIQITYNQDTKLRKHDCIYFIDCYDVPLSSQPMNIV